MLVFGDYTCLKPVMKNFFIFNLASSLEGFERVDIIPRFQMEYSNRDFDVLYAKYIMETDSVFYEFMKIIISLYNGFDVFILTNRSGFYEDIIESLQKLIQQRYGIISNIINEPDDWNYVQESCFNINGLYNLDIDKERYAVMFTNLNLDTILKSL